MYKVCMNVNNNPYISSRCSVSENRLELLHLARLSDLVIVILKK